MISDRISRLKNSFLLPKAEMPNHSHLERLSSQNSSAVTKGNPNSISIKHFQELAYVQYVLSNPPSDASLFSARLARPLDIQFRDGAKQAQCSRSSRKTERVVLAAASCVPLESV